MSSEALLGRMGVGGRAKIQRERGMGTKRNKKKKKTYNTGDSLVVTDPTTNPAVVSLSMGERTGSRVF